MPLSVKLREVQGAYHIWACLSFTNRGYFFPFTSLGVERAVQCDLALSRCLRGNESLVHHPQSSRRFSLLHLRSQCVRVIHRTVPKGANRRLHACVVRSTITIPVCSLSLFVQDPSRSTYSMLDVRLCFQDCSTGQTTSYSPITTTRRSSRRSGRKTALH